ncbi:MAG: T9SS type A sorting domain-containing protein [Bacteroidota bacterium]
MEDVNSADPQNPKIGTLENIPSPPWATTPNISTLFNLGTKTQSIHFAVSTAKSYDGQINRNIYLSNGSSIFLVKLNNSGLIFENFLDMPFGIKSFIKSEMELHEYANGTSKLAVPISNGSGNSIAIVDLDSEGNFIYDNTLGTYLMEQISFIDIDPTAEDYIPAYIKGLEFSKDGRYLYFNHSINSDYPNPLGYFDLTNTNYTPVYYTGLTSIQKNAIQFSQLELSTTGRIYMHFGVIPTLTNNATSNALLFLNNASNPLNSSNNPSGSVLNSANVAIDLLVCRIADINGVNGVNENAIYLLPTQIDGEANPAGLTVTASPDVSICSAQNVVLSVLNPSLPATEYQWYQVIGVIDGQNIYGPLLGTGFSISVSPTQTTQYAVVVNATNFCGNSIDFVWVNIISPPNIAIVGNNSQCYGNLQEYYISFASFPPPFSSGEWSIEPANAGTFIDGINTGNNVQIDWSTMPSTGATINFAFSFGPNNLCRANIKLDVLPCCNFSSSCTQLSGYGPTSTNFFPISTWQQTSVGGPCKITLDGFIRIDQDFTFDNALVELGPNAQIKVASGVTLTITNNSVLRARCDAMWDGIYPESNSTIIINDGSTIQDAVWGVRVTSKNNVTLNIGESGNNVLFNKNRVSIYLLRVSNSSISIKNTEFNSKITDYASTAFLLNPHLDQNPYAGIVLDRNFQDITIGEDSQNNQNRFENLDFGINSNRTSFTLLNNYFSNLSSNSSQTCSCNAGPNTAVYASGGTLESDAFFVNIGNQGLGQNIFENVNNGVYLYNNFESMIDNNVFNTISKNGITINGVLNRQNISIINNELNNIRNIYISLVDNPKANKIIENNSINLNNPPSNYLFGSGINISETAKSPAKNSIFRNNISAVQTGIYTNGVNESTIVDNDIFLNTNTSNNPGNGILCNKGDKLSIYDNNIEAAHRDNYWVNGIRIEFCTNSIVNCNSMQRTGGGVFVGGSCKGTIIYKNNLRRNYWGYVANYSVSGPPASNYYSDNIWTGPYDNNTWSGGTYWHTLNVGSDPYANRLYVRPNDGTPYKPNPFYSTILGPTQNLEPDLFDANIGPIYYPTGLQEHDVCGNTIAEDLGKGDEGMAMQIIAGQIESPEYNNTMQWWLKYQLYNQLKEEDISAYFQIFMDSTANAGIGKLSEIQEKLNDSLNYQTTELELLLAQNQGITASGITEEELKFINAQAIEMALMEKNEEFAGYNLQNLNAPAMENLAWECPLAKGPAVFTARVLMNKLNTDFIRYCNACETLAPNTGNNQRTGVIQPKPYQYDESEAYDLDILAEEKPTNTKQFLGVNLFPNPSNGTVNFEFKDATAITSIEIYNSLGALVLVENVNGNNNLVQINANELSNGFYLAKIISNKGFATKSFTFNKYCKFI